MGSSASAPRYTPEELAEQLRIRRRCPRCQSVVLAAEDGRCRRCRKTSPLEKWDEWTETAPVQPEELNGGRCRECGNLLDLMRPGRKGWFEPLSYLALMTMLVTEAALAGPDRSHLPIVFVFLAGLGAFALFVLFRTPTGRLLRTTIVSCRSCGAIRVAGRADGPDISRLHRGRAAVRRARRMLMAAYLFLLVACLAAWIVDGRAPRGTLLALMAVSGAIPFPAIFLRVYFPPPRDAWEYLFPK